MNKVLFIIIIFIIIIIIMIIMIIMIIIIIIGSEKVVKSQRIKNGPIVQL